MPSLASKSIEKLRNSDLSGKTVLLRLDLNVPVEDDKVVETFRIDQALPTIEFLQTWKAKIILMSHIESVNTLAPVAKYLDRHLKLTFAKDLTEARELKEKMESGGVILLENLRQNQGEKENFPLFARELASLGDIYVNEAFACSHRAHASIVGVPKILKKNYLGFLFMKEVENLSQAFKPKHPFLFILGGAKFGTKIPLVKKYLKSADQIFVGGALANSLMAEQGFAIGQSKAEEIPGGKTLAKQKKIILPTDVVTESARGVFIRQKDRIEKEDVVMDAGPETVKMLGEAIEEAKFILWNGPLGNFEKGFNRATLDVAKAVARSGALSIVGGGDTVSAISALNLNKKFGFVSTAGGAMLDFLANETLPGIGAITGN